MYSWKYKSGDDKIPKNYPNTSTTMKLIMIRITMQQIIWIGMIVLCIFLLRCCDSWTSPSSSYSSRNVVNYCPRRCDTIFLQHCHTNLRYYDYNFRKYRNRLTKTTTMRQQVRNNSMRLYDGTILGVNTCEEEEEEENDGTNSDIKFDDLIDMDVVIYSLDKNNDNSNDNNKLYLGAIQEDGILSPISAWTIEPAFGESIEFLVHDDDRFLLSNKNKNENNSIIGTGTGTGSGTSNSIIRIHHLLSESEVSYSSRQCQRGVDNPHGEESELIYYISQTLIDEYTQNPKQKIDISMKPDLEILW